MKINYYTTCKSIYCNFPGQNKGYILQTQNVPGLESENQLLYHPNQYARNFPGQNTQGYITNSKMFQV
jgi:hypothetical protein